MALQMSDTALNALLDAIETATGVSPTMEIRSGAPPANCAAADSGTVLATLTLPSDWMAAAASHVKAKAGTWEDASADAGGVAGHFRIKAGATTHLQGTCGQGSGDLSFDNATFVAGQKITITGFTLTAGNI
jgi:hypothetical protein